MAEFNTTADTLCNEEPHPLPQEAKPDIELIEPCVGSAPAYAHALPVQHVLGVVLA